MNTVHALSRSVAMGKGEGNNNVAFFLKFVGFGCENAQFSTCDSDAA